MEHLRKPAHNLEFALASDKFMRPLRASDRAFLQRRCVPGRLDWRSACVALQVILERLAELDRIET